MKKYKFKNPKFKKPWIKEKDPKEESKEEPKNEDKKPKDKDKDKQNPKNDLKTTGLRYEFKERKNLKDPSKDGNQQEKDLAYFGKYYEAMKALDPRIRQAFQFPQDPPIWDMEYPDYSVCLFMGRRKTGKTVMMDYLLYEFQDKFQQIYVFTGTRLNGRWQARIPDRYVFHKFQESRIKQILKTQEEIISARKKDKKAFANYDERTLIILDDVIADRIWKNKTLDALATKGRHYHIDVWIATQNPTGISPEFRDNCDLIFCYLHRSIREFEHIHDDFFGLCPKQQFMANFCSIVMDPENEHTCVVVDPMRSVTEGNIFKFHAVLLEDVDYKVGSKLYWLIAKELDRRELKSRKRNRTPKEIIKSIATGNSSANDATEVIQKWNMMK